MKISTVFNGLLSFFLLFILTACSDEDQYSCEEHSVSACEEDASKINIRILNQSDYDYCNVVIDPNSRETNFGSIDKGDITCYRTYDLAYDYAYIQLFINSNEFLNEPLDWVGEEPLNNGFYTYIIGVRDFENRVLSEQMVRDNAASNDSP